MNLNDLIYKNRKGPFANANSANPANSGPVNGQTLAELARLALAKSIDGFSGIRGVSKISNISISNDEIQQSLSISWCKPIDPTEFRKRRAELVRMIEALATLEGWPRDDLDDILARAINGPVSDLWPNWHHFTERLAEAQSIHKKGGRTRK